MRPLISLVSLACSILVLVGVFLPWLRSGGGFFSSSTAGWDLTNFEIGTFSLWPGWYGSTDGVVQSFPEPQVMLAGGIMMFFCAFASCAITMYSRKEEGLLRALGIGFTLGAVIASVSAVWFFIRASNLGEDMSGFGTSFGLYLCAVCAFLGVALGVATMARTYRALQTEPEIAPAGSIPVALGALAVGTLAFMGTFLPWFKMTMLNIPMVVNGWTLDSFNAEPAMEPYFAQIYMVLAGSVILGTFGMLSYVISKTATMGKGFYPFSSGAALFGALLTAFGVLWFFLQVGGRMEAITFGAGPFVSLLAALAWLCVGLLPSRSLQAVAVEPAAAEVSRSPAEAAPVLSATEEFKRASDLEAMGRHEDAIAAYSRAIELDEGHALAHFNRGSLYIALGETAAAVGDFQRVIALSDNDELINRAKQNLEELSGR